MGRLISFYHTATPLWRPAPKPEAVFHTVSGRALLRFLGLFALLPLLFGATGCRAGFLLQAAKGEYRLLTEAIPVSKALEGDALTEEEKERLLLVKKAKAFGEEELGLTPTDNYTSVYAQSRELPIYTVSAAPKDRLVSVNWCFPVVGCMPYLGFFDLEDAKNEVEKLEEQGFDVSLGVAAAFSTLGWFKDPVTLDILKEPSAEMVETLIHEMTHTTIYVKDQPEFNEGFATLVGLYGARAYFETACGPGHPLTIESERRIEDERTFSTFLYAVLLRLETLYNTPLSYTDKIALREEIFLDAKREFKRVKTRLHTKVFDFFEKSTLNNANMFVLSIYHAHFTLFENILEENLGSTKETIALFRHLAETKDLLIPAGREWLGERRASDSSLNRRRSTLSAAELKKLHTNR